MSEVQMTPDFVAVPDGEVGFNNAGATVWWRLTSAVDVSTVRRALVTHGIDEGLPRPPQAETALRRALAGLSGRRRLVRPIKKGVWSLVLEEEANERLHHEQRLTVRLDKVGRPIVEPGQGVYTSQIQQEADAIRDAFSANLDLLSTSDVSSWLTDAVVWLGGVPLRESGGVYFVPPGRPLERWKAIAKALESVAAGTLYQMATMRTQDAVKAITDSLATEIWAALDTMRAELISEDLGVRALENRAAQAKQLKSKVVQYERLLGTSLQKLADAVNAIDVDVAAAKLAAEKDED